MKKQIAKILSIFLVLVVVASCTSKTNTEVISESKNIPVLHPPLPPKPNIKKIKKIKIGKEKEIKKELHEGDSDIIVVFEIEEFDKIVYNISELIKYSSNLEKTVEYYRNINK